MHNIFLIARREYLERIRAKSFLVMTVLIPMLMGGLLLGAKMVNGQRSSTLHIAVLTSDQRFSHDLETELRSDDNKARVETVAPAAEARAVLDGQLKAGKMDGYLVVTPSPNARARPRFEWVPKSTADIITKANVAHAIRSSLTREGLASGGMSQADVAALLAPIELNSGTAGKVDKSVAAIGSAYALFFLMYFVILFYGMNVARSIIEEKTSRIFEVLLATIKPEEMLAGKVLGVGAVGLTQVGIWILAAGLYIKFVLIAAGVSIPITGTQVGFFVLFFLLGYLLYSSLAAALGAMTNSEQELQQLNMVLMLPLIACSIIIFRVITDADGLLARGFSFFPFCTPLIMYVRIAVGHPAPWEVALSIVDLILMIAVVLWFASRIYRVGILMYGKKPNLPEIVRWLKYS